MIIDLHSFTFDTKIGKRRFSERLLALVAMFLKLKWNFSLIFVSCEFPRNQCMEKIDIKETIDT